MNLLFVSYGVGGTEALNTLYMNFKKESELEVENIAITDFAFDKLTDCKRIDKEKIFDYIWECNSDIVINERSNGLDIQNAITKFCKENSIKNIAVLDFYGEYAKRFICTPDLIIVPGQSIILGNNKRGI